MQAHRGGGAASGHIVRTRPRRAYGDRGTGGGARNASARITPATECTAAGTRTSSCMDARAGSSSGTIWESSTGKYQRGSSRHPAAVRGGGVGGQHTGAARTLWNIGARGHHNLKHSTLFEAGRRIYQDDQAPAPRGQVGLRREAPEGPRQGVVDRRGDVYGDPIRVGVRRVDRQGKVRRRPPAAGGQGCGGRGSPAVHYRRPEAIPPGLKEGVPRDQGLSC